MKKYMLPGFILMTLLAYQNCSDVSFQNAKPLIRQSCTKVLETTNKNIRIIFMVDDSGSTLDTDPNKNYRALAIQDFIAKYGSKSNFAYAFGEFESSRASFYNVQTNAFVNIGANSNTANIVGTSTHLSAALNSYLGQTINSSANTPYREAMEAIQRVVLNDIDATNSLADKPNYAIVFMSDGEPNPNLSNTAIRNLVKDLKNAAINKSRIVTVSTVYFGPANKNTAKEKLIDMADEGDGQFVDTNVSNDLTIETVVTVPGEICTG